ncbi:10606_t:CDS:2 [Entrophospora sp. SA101]|nr:10606_t:CDS:2 [Entrophospora sp. SA101]
MTYMVNWQDMHKDFGLESWEYKYALYAQSKNYNLSTVNCEELKKEYHQTQTYLFCYPKERTCLRKNKRQLLISSTIEISQEEVEVIRIDEAQEPQAQIEILPKQN